MRRLALMIIALAVGTLSGRGQTSREIGNRGEKELLAIMEAAAGRQIEHCVYVDMDHDGAEELMGVCTDDDDRYNVWYCSSDGSLCKAVHRNDDWMEDCEFQLLDLGRETHVVLNAYRMMGTVKNFTILGLQNHDINCILSNQYGYVCMRENGDITLDVEAYDGMYDPEIDGYIMHTWKDTYLYYEGGTYKEYGATQIPEEEFLQLGNAGEIKSSIAGELTEQDTAEIDFSYFRRANGILHIQCAVHKTSGVINYLYYTVRYADNGIVGGIGEANYGQILECFSDLEVTY